jgi:hypothetical protein
MIADDWQVDTLRIIQDIFSWNWLSGFRGEFFLNSLCWMAIAKNIYMYLQLEIQNSPCIDHQCPKKIHVHVYKIYQLVSNVNRFISYYQKASDIIISKLVIQIYFLHKFNSLHTFNRVCEWLLFNTKWAISQLYHGKNKLHFNDTLNDDDHFVLGQHHLDGFL